jgi:hypothetical protein
MHEPVSPELALVDPELARRLRAALIREAAQVEALAVPLPVKSPETDAASEPVVREEAGRRLWRLPLLAGIMVAGFAVAVVMSDVHRSAPATAAASTLGAFTPSPSDLRTSTALSNIGDVERAVFGLLPAAVRASKLPRSIVDPATGLAYDGTVVHCRPGALPSRFHCEVETGTSSSDVVVLRDQGDKLTILRSGAAAHSSS